MELIFLGTSAGTPTRHRNVSSMALCAEGNKHWYMVDCGEGTQHQLLNCALSLHHLKAIFITHVHGDHCYGLPGLLASAGLSGRKSPLTIVCPKAVVQMITAVKEATDLWLNFELNFVIAETQSEPISLDDFDVELLPLSHRVPCWGYNFVERNIERQLDQAKLTADSILPGPCWGELQRGQDVILADGRQIKAADYQLPPRKPRVIFVGGDNDQPQRLDSLNSKPDVMIHEATYTQAVSDKVGPAPMHSSAKRVAQYAERANIANLILTHFSSRYAGSDKGQSNILEVETEAQLYYRGVCYLANDFDRYQLPKRGELRLLKGENG